MKARVFSFSFLLCALLPGFLTAAQSKVQSQGKTSKPPASPAAVSSLSISEKDVLNEINELRAHPEKYVTYLEALRPFFNDKQYRNGDIGLLTQEGWGAVEDAIKFLKAAKPQPPLSLSQGLCLAAASHVKEQSTSGATGHQGARSTMIEDRVKPFGSWAGGIGENLSYGKETARDRILTWLIDDGFANRGHRKRLLSPDYKVAGLSCGPHPEFGTMCVVAMAGGFTDLRPKASPSTKPATTKRTTTKKTAKSRSI